MTAPDLEAKPEADLESDADGLDALAAKLEPLDSGVGAEELPRTHGSAPRSEDELQAEQADLQDDDDLDLAMLAKVAGAGAVVAAAEPAAATEDAKVVLAGAPAPSARPAAVSTEVAAAAAVVVPLASQGVQAPAPGDGPARGFSGAQAWRAPVALVFALGLGVGGYVLGRSSQPATSPGQTEAIGSAPAPPAAPAQHRPATIPLATQVLPREENAGPEVAAAPAQTGLAASAPAESSAVASDALRPAAALPQRSAVSAGGGNGRAQDASRAPRAVQEAQIPKAEARAVVAADDVAVPSAPKLAAAAIAAKAEPTTSPSVDALLDQALSPGHQRALAPSESALPQTPSREDVTQAMAVLLPAIRGCAMGQTGLATAGIVVRADGRVASVELSGAPFEGTASGRCMEGVLRRARFSRFVQPTFRVRFPFAIQ